MPRNFPEDAKASTDQTFTCDDCGKTAPAWTILTGGGGTGNFGYLAESPKKTICPACCASRDKATMGERHASGESFSSYLLKGNTIGTWHGEPIARVTESHPTKRNPGAYGFLGDVLHIRCVDDAGRCWHGYGIPGMCITLWPCKG